MKHWPRLFLLGLFLSVGPAAPAQVPPENTLPTFTVAPGLEITLWAAEPLFSNPTCMDIDHKGRVWICESVNYRQFLRGRPPLRPEGDRILILEDSRGTGRADRVTTFYQSKETVAPLGIAVAKDPEGPGYQVYVCQSPDILLFEDKDGDGKADGPPRKLLSGFRGVDHDHGVHGILIGPDGKLYFSVGDQGVSGLVDKNGKTWSTNQTDCRAGTIWRCDLDGKHLELLAHNFRNEYEPCVDSFGTIFVSDNDDDGNQQTRICYVMPGGNYGYHPRGPGQSHWHEEQPGVVPKILRTYFGSPTGMCVYEGTLLPEKYRNQLLHTDAGPRQLRCYHLKPEGAGYAVEQEEIASSSDNWFRPSDVCVAPDGSLFVADWYDPGVGGHGMGDTTRGRIFRIAPKGNRPSVPNVNLETNEGLTAALASPALSVRSMAMAKLKLLPPRALLAVLEDALKQRHNPVLRARALWQLGQQTQLLADRSRDTRGAPASELEAVAQARERYVKEALSDDDARFRILAIRLLRDFRGLTPAHDAFPLRIENDPSAAVRREALLALRDADPTKAKPLLLGLSRDYDGKDRFYLAALGIAVGQDKVRREILLADFTFRQWNDQVANLVWELRPAQVLPLLERRLGDATLPATQRSQIVDILASADDLNTAKVLLQALQADVPKEVSDRLVANFKLFLPGKWRSLRSSPELGEAISRLLKDPMKRAAALALIAASEKADTVASVAALAQDIREPLPVRSAAIQTLGALPSAEASGALEPLLQTEPAALRVEVVQALANQIQPGDRRAAPSSALPILQKLALAAERDLELRRATLLALMETRAGTLWLLDAGARKDFPEALKPEVGRLLRNSPHQDLRNRALVAFPPPSRLDPNKLPVLAGLLPRKGNPDHGAQLMKASVKSDLQCLKCHTVRGVGGNTGPDLSAIGLKASRENLFESLLLPNKAIADQYITWVIETKKGLTLTGLLVEETADYVTLRDANGKDTRIDKREIDTRAKSPNSLMPSDLLAYMTEDDLVDLIEYLASLKSDK